MWSFWTEPSSPYCIPTFPGVSVNWKILRYAASIDLRQDATSNYVSSTKTFFEQRLYSSIYYIVPEEWLVFLEVLKRCMQIF